MNAFRTRMFMAAAGGGGGAAPAAAAPAAAAPAAAAPVAAAAPAPGNDGGRVGAKSGLTPGDQAAMAAMAPAAGGVAALPDGYYGLAEKPEWVDGRFYDPEKKAIRVPDLAKSWSEANQKIMAKTEDLKSVVEREFNENRLKARPETPDKYVAKLPEAFKLPDGRTYTPDEKNPMMSWWRKTAHDNGLSQEQFEEGIATYMQGVDYGLPDLEAEMKQLGENGQRRIDTLVTFLKANVGEKHLKALAPMATSAAAIEAMEAIMTLSAARPMGDGNRQPVTIRSESELRQMQMDPRYRDPHRRDPNFVKEVTEGFQRLYGKS